MPLILDNPIQMPALHGNPAVTVDAVKVAWFAIDIDGKELFFRVNYGSVATGAFVASKDVPQGNYVVVNTIAKLGPPSAEYPDGQPIPASPDFDLLVATVTTTAADEIVPGDGGHKVYRGASRGLYEWLVSNGHYQGLIV